MPDMINSVNGLLAVDKLGTTLMHEHILQANWSMRMSFKDWFDYDSFIEWAAEDAKRTKEIGVQTLVEQTPVCLGRDIHAVRDVADQTGMQIIASTGFFYIENQWMFLRSEGNFVKWLMKDIEEGIQDTDIKPGLIKCGTDTPGVTDINRILLKAHAEASKKSGLPIATHSWYKNRSGISQMEIFEEAGLNPKKILIGHCGDTNDLAYLEELLRRGCFIGLDRFGDEAKNSLENRVNTLINLCDRGWIKQIMISHDYVSFVDMGNFEWQTKRLQDTDDASYNSRYIHRFALPMLRARGFKDAEINRLMTENPRAYFGAE